MGWQRKGNKKLSFIFKASAILRFYLLFCLTPGVKGLTVMETGGCRFIALLLGSLANRLDAESSPFSP